MTSSRSNFPLSNAQRDIWVDQVLNKNIPLYNIGGYVKIEGSIDVGLFERAVNLLVEKHDALRLVLDEEGSENGLPVQCFLPKLSVAVPLIDFSLEIDAHLVAKAWMQKRFVEPYALSGGPLFRFDLLKINGNEYWWLAQYHHLITDGWGGALLNRSLADLYTSLSCGSNLNVIAPSFRDHLNSELFYSQSDKFEIDRQYWLKQYQSVPSPPIPPQYRSQLKSTSASGGCHTFYLPSQMYRRLGEFSELCNASMFHVIIAALVSYFGRISQQDRLVVGLPILNRRNAKFRDTAGLFAGIIPIPFTIDPDDSVINLVKNIGLDLRRHYRHQRFPVSEINRGAERGGAEGNSQLFDLSVNYAKQSHDVFFDGSAAKSTMLDTNVGQTPLAVSIWEFNAGEDVQFDFSYNVDYFNTEDVEAISERFVNILEQFLASPERRLSDISITTASERKQLLVGWNDTKTDYPSGHCIHQFFERQVKKNPEAVALIFDEQEMSYRELNSQANQLANYLVSEKNIRPDTLVGICLERSFEMVIAILAITKAGGAYVPLDPDYPEARLAYLLEDAGLDTVITNSDVFTRTPITPSQAVCLNKPDVQVKISLQPFENLELYSLGLTSAHLVYVIYTSGSTGHPKGVMVGHKAIVNRIHWMHEQYGASAQDVFLQKTPFSFDVSVWEFFWPLMAGAQLVIAKPQGHTDPVYLNALVQEKGVTKLHFVPSMLSAMLSGSSLSECQSLQQVFCSGEALAINHVRDFYAALPSSELHNLYGPTEAAVDVSYWACPAQESPHASVPIGRPINNIQLHVLDKQLQLLPQGVVGELHIGGIGLARGYLNRTELTAEKFIQNPFSTDAADRLYKTGDLVRWLADGNLEYIGRIDDQVKIRGFRVELGEIENTLLAHESIIETAVVTREETGDKRIVAYVVMKGDVPEDEVQMDAWRQHLSNSLPEYMLPSNFVVLEALPLTANGKLDRKALPAPDMSQQQSIYVAPATDTEKLLCEIWQDILNLEQVGVTDNFFRLGGHSLLLIQLLARLQEVGRHTDVHSLFRATSLGELAEQLDTTEESPASEFKTPENLIPESSDVITPEMLSLVRLEQTAIDKIVAAVPGGAANIQDVYPLAPLQEGILFHHQMSDGVGDTYVMPVLLATKTRPQRDEFLQALQSVVNRHDVLRSAVLWEGLPQAVQVVCRQVDLSITSLTLNPNAEAMPQLLELMAPAQQFMDITEAPLLRVQLAEDPQSGKYFVLLQLHHIISDHVGLEIIQAEIQAILQGKENTLTSPASYREFVAHTQHQAQTLDVEKFFKEKLASITEPTAPFNLLDVHGSGGEIVEANQLLPRALSQHIRSLSRRLAVSPAALFHTGFGLVVAACSGRDDVVFGTVLSGRLQGTAGAGRMLGMFINTLPCRLTLKGIGTEAMVLQAQAELLGLLPYEQASLVLAQQCSGLPSGTPLFSALLNYRHSSPEDNDLTEKSGIDVLHVHEYSNYPFAISIDDLDDGFEVTAQVNVDIDPFSVLEYLQIAMEGLVEALDETPEKPVLDIDILPVTERHQLLVEWNDTETEGSKERCIHELFEAQVNNNPDAMALAFDGRKLTYGELNKQANQLAHYLITEKCVQPDTLVGICLERSLEMVIAILGVLKAGGAYVPLDPDYPAARLAYMLDDAALDTVITHGAVLACTEIVSEQALCWDDESTQQLISLQPHDNIIPKEIGLRSDHLAYVIYTSGSTGKPKGVMITHKGLPSLMDDNGEQFQISKDTRFLQSNSINFDAASWVIWMALSHGAELVIAKNLLATKEEIETFICQKEISHLMMTPSSLNVLDPGTLTNLKCVIVGGDTCLQELADRWTPFCSFFNAYGPTENTICTTVKKIEYGKIVSIGQPVNNSHVYVLHGDKLQPIGVAGELCIGGIGLARGYLNRPDLTEEKFIPNPFSESSSDHLYRTGDLVRWLSDGNLEYLGRLDDQVKVRGYRIELGEIENALLSHESIKNSVVMAWGDSHDIRIVAYVVTSHDGAVDTQMDSWRRYLSQSLPEYMLPSIFVVLDVLPLTPNGKIDRKSLRAPDITQQDAYVAPITETEKVLCEIWQDILGLEKVGVTDNFFRLGGHSLLLIQLLARLQITGRATDVRNLFSAESLAELAAQLDVGSESTARAYRAPDNLIPVCSDVITPEMLSLITLDQSAIDNIVSSVPGGATNIQDIYPLAPLQEGILFHHQMSDGVGDLYVLPALFATKTRQKRDDFLAALQSLVNRHDVLRSAVLWQGLPQAIQVVCRRIVVPLESLELNSDMEVMPQLLERMQPDQQFMDITQAPLLRVQLAEDPESGRYFILLQLHHIIADHVGLEIIQADVQAILQGKEELLSSPAPYREFVAHSVHQSKTQNAEIYFRDKLGSISEPTAPFNFLDVQSDVAEIIEASQQFSYSLSLRIRALSRQLAVSPAALFHTVFGLVVGICSGRDEVVFGTVLSGRLQGTLGAGRMLGMFINTLPYNLMLRDMGAEDLVFQAQSELLDLLPYEQTSLTLAQQCSGLPSGTPLFSAMLNYRHSDPNNNDLSFDEGIEFLAGHERTNYPFTVSVDDRGKDFNITAQVNAAIDPVRILGYLQTAMGNLVDALECTPKKLVLDIEVISSAEQQQLLLEWNDAVKDIPEERCIHELFEEQAKNNPDAIALVFNKEKLSYRELNSKANQLANYLVKEKQIQPDTLVGICLERSLEMVIAILAVLKAGGAYVPLDPDYPEARLAYMLDDAGLDTVITNFEVLARTPVSLGQALCWDDERIQHRISVHSCENVIVDQLGVSVSHLAYVIYTSGSTGKPKGVMVEHGSFTSHIKLVANTYKIGLHDNVSQFSNISFDAASEQIFVTLCSGGTLNLCPERYLASHDFVRWVLASGLTVINLPPSYALAVLPILITDSDFLEGNRLRLVIIGGEKFPAKLFEDWKKSEISHQCRLMNAYGPTETCITSHLCFVGDDQNSFSHIGGTVGAGYSLILDESNGLTPFGVIGELCIGGARVARGYLNSPALTEKVFVQNPFSDDPNDRLYKTGDLVRWLSSGNLEYIGRRDDQVKIRGFRIELGEIENTLLTDESINQAVVVAREYGSDTRLVAYVVTSVSAVDDESSEIQKTKAWYQHLSQTLPEYMLPSSIVVLEAFPLTPNGKVDHKALPAPDLAQQQDTYLAPTTDTEKALCGIWQEVLGLEQVGVTDNFFRLGGHSLSMTKVAILIKQELSVDIPLKTLFKINNIQLLAESLDVSGLSHITEFTEELDVESFEL